MDGKEIRFIDLFAGVGGFHRGLTQIATESGESKQVDRRQQCPNSKGNDANEQHSPSGFRCVWASEWDKYAAAVYRRNFPETPLSTSDIRTVEADSVPDHDLLCAGFPCQAFSVAGKRRGLEEARGTLFYEIARIAERKRPRLLLLENVKGLLSHDGGRSFATILRVLGGVGYRCEWQVLNSKWFGVPQSRERVFIVGHLGGEPTRTVFPITEVGGGDNEAGARPVARCLNGGGYSGGLHSQMTLLYDNYNHSFKDEIGAVKTNEASPSSSSNLLVQPVLTSDRPEKRQDTHGVMVHAGYRGVDDGKLRVYEDVSPTISTPSGGGHLPYIANTVDVDGYLRFGERPRDKNGKAQLVSIGQRRIRRLTPVECERLQAFPDGWTSEGVFPDGSVKPISDTQRYKQMGNAVTTNVVRFIGERIPDIW